MVMRRIIILTAVAALVCATAFAQGNLNPTVEVTNTYQGDPSAVHKPQIGMAIPDSLLRFDMDFGYEVFEKPYQGAYNFKPYLLAMRPDKDAFRGKNLYVKAGAGYSLHPLLDVVFSPEPKGPFQMSVYASNRSYIGKYNTLQAEIDDGVNKVSRVAGESFNGYDVVNLAGFEGDYLLDKTIISFGVDYNGLLAKDDLFRRSYNAADFGVRVRSNRSDEKYIFYDISLDGLFAGDHRVEQTPADGLWPNVNERTFTLSGEAGPVLGQGRAALLGFEAETVSYSNLFKANTGKLALVPKYRMTYGKWDLSLGVRLEAVIKNQADGGDYLPSMFQKEGGIIFPDVHISCDPIDNLRVYASATGGNKLNTYTSLLSRNHFLQPRYHSRYLSEASTLPSLLDGSVEKVNARIGVKGKVASMLQFDIDGGVAFVDNGLLDGAIVPFYYVSAWPDSPYSGAYAVPVRFERGHVYPVFNYADYSLVYADALVDLTLGDLRLDGGVHFRQMALENETDSGLLLPKMTFDFKAVYDFSSRVYAGLRLQAAGTRKGRICEGLFFEPSADIGLIIPPVPSDIRVPGWLDLGILGGWQFNRKLGFWLESGNLLCETIQRTPFYSEKDLWITAGITLNL